MTGKDYQELEALFQKARAKGFYQETPERAVLLDKLERVLLAPGEEFTREEEELLREHFPVFLQLHVFCRLHDI